MITIPNTIVLNTGTAAEKREKILHYYNTTLALEELLYSTLANDAAYYKRADPLRHPLIFYFGHTAVFMVNKLILAKLTNKRIDPEMESIFAIGVDEMSWDDLNEKHYNWPSVENTLRYRQEVSALVRELIMTLPLELPIDWDSAYWPLLMGIEHMKIHIETSSVLMRQLPIAMVKPNTLGKRCMVSGKAPSNEMIDLPGGAVTLGKERGHHLYGWDNEYGHKEEVILPFKAAKYLVSNQEFLDFVVCGAYEKEDYWTAEGWAWRSYTQATQPLFWIKDGDSYNLRLVDEIIAMPWDWPVEINYLEAKAFCNWKSEQTQTKLRMPTEAEWMHLYGQHQINDIDAWGRAPGNINMEHYSSPCPVSLFAFGDFYDLIGNVWQWTETPISGYPGFEVHPLYDDFSTPTFDDQHNLFKGGSWISTGNEATKHARYAFRRHFYQHAGFRYIEAAHPPVIESNTYETDEAVAASCEANYGEGSLGLGNHPSAVAKIALEHLKTASTARVLDINCDTGRLAFELSKEVAHVTALDASARYIKMAIQMQEKGQIRYIIKNEGELVYYREKQLQDYGVSAAMAQKVQFMQADAANIKQIYTGYDMIIATGLLEELYDPKQFLQETHKRLNKDGILILTSAYDWNTKDTQRDHWLGGFKKDGEPVYSSDSIAELLASDYVQVGKTYDLARVHRISSRSYKVKQEEVSVWQKK